MLLSVLPLLLSLHLFLARSPHILINCFQTSLGSVRGNGRSMMCPFLWNFHSSVLPWALVLRVLEDLENIIFSDLLFEFITSLISIPGFNQGSWRGPVNTIQDCLTPVVLQGWGKVCSHRLRRGEGRSSFPKRVWQQLRQGTASFLQLSHGEELRSSCQGDRISKIWAGECGSVLCCVMLRQIPGLKRTSFQSFPTSPLPGSLLIRDRSFSPLLFQIFFNS